MLNILLMIVLIIIIFIIILLFFGVRIALTYEKKGSCLKGCLKVLIFKKIKVYSKTYPDPDEDEDNDEEENEKDRDGQKIFELLKPCLRYFIEFLQAFVKCISVVKLENHLVFGLDSYADTGKYIGYIWGMASIVNGTHEKARLSAEPSFNGSVFDIKGVNELDINILKLIPAAIKLISKKEVRLFIKGVRNGR